MLNMTNSIKSCPVIYYIARLQIYRSRICWSRFQSFRVQEANYQDQYHYKKYVHTYSNTNLFGRNEKKRDPNVNNQCHFFATTVISKVGISA